MNKLWLMYRVVGVFWVVVVVVILFWPIPDTEVSAPQPNDEITQPTTIVPETAPTIPTENTPVREDIPFDEETQLLLHRLCKDLGVPYELVLAVIWRETNFENVMGDNGASAGYMQVQEQHHSDRMERHGVTDLMDPYGNFLVGCDYLAELIEKDRGLEWALMAYNGGPTYANKMAKAGKTSQYAKDVLNYMNELKMEEM